MCSVMIVEQCSANVVMGVDVADDCDSRTCRNLKVVTSNNIEVEAVAWSENHETRESRPTWATWHKF